MIRVCSSCGAKNRVPVRHLSDTGKCGSCHTGLPPQDEPIEVDGETFDAIVGASRVPVLVDFWAAWCGPCRAAAPEVHRAAKQAAGRAVFLKVDTEAHPQLAARYGVRGIPNFVVIRNGNVVRQEAGVVDAATLVEWLS